MNPTYIAGKDHEQYDKTDWEIPRIPVRLNPANLPPTTTVTDAEQMIKDACFSWALRYNHELYYAGLTQNTVVRNSVVINYNSSAQLMEWYGKEVNGLCRYHTDGYIGDTRRLVSAEIYINGDNRPLPNRFARATIKHELGHACGIHGHNDQPGSVMYTSSMGNEKLTLQDVQMLDNWAPYSVELNKDFSLSCPAVNMPDGNVKWVDLKYTGNALLHSWSLAKETPWGGPVIDNVTVGGMVVWQSHPGQRISMKSVKGQGLDLSKVDLVLFPNGNIVLEYAE